MHYGEIKSKQEYEKKNQKIITENALQCELMLQTSLLTKKLNFLNNMDSHDRDSRP